MSKIVIEVKDLEKAKTGDVLVYDADKKCFYLVCYVDYNKKLYDRIKEQDKTIKSQNEKIDALIKEVNKRFEFQDKVNKLIVK